MNQRLATLLSAATGDTRPLAWSNVLLVTDYTPVPIGDCRSTPVGGSSGFSLVVLGPDGAPKWYCKCRPGDDDAMRRSTGIRHRLHEEPRLHDIVPDATLSADDRLLMQVAPFVTGTPFEAIVPLLDSGHWFQETRSILKIITLLADGATDVLTDVPTQRESVDLEAEMDQPLQALASELNPAQTDALRDVAHVAGLLPRRQQHGDMWPANVIRFGESWCILDFDDFGIVQVPMYDVLQLVRSCLRQRYRSAAPLNWPAIMVAGGEDVAAARALLRDWTEEHGLSAAQARGALAFYCAYRAAIAPARGWSLAQTRDLVNDVRALADALICRTSIDFLFFGR